MQKLRIFVSSPGDVKAAREIAALTIERLAQDYARFLIVEPYLWEFEAMVASGHFQDSIEPPSAFDVVVLIVWSRLGTSLPQRTGVREYRGIDGRSPVTGTEWEFEEALSAAQTRGAPDLLVYRSRKPAPFDTRDPDRFDQQSQQLKALNGFWERHFANQGMFIGAYTSFTTDAEFAAAFEMHLRKLIEKRIASLAASRSDAVAKAWTHAPFRGLEAYEFEHAPIFFGQDEALAKAMLQLTANAEAGSPFLLVVGASGSGKSSLVKAGLLPKLFVPRRIAGAAFMRRVVFRPSDAQEHEDLFDALARRLTTQLSGQEGLSELLGHGQSAASLAAHLRSATAAPAFPIGSALGQLTLQARQAGRMLEYESAKLVLVVDQLEELFTGERISAGERVHFIALLAGLVRSGLVWVVATMRRDFWHRADETPELLDLSEGNGRIELAPPTAPQLSQMVRRPAEAAGVAFEVHGTTNVSLNEVIAEEVAREPGALPLLSYLLDQLYRIDVLEGHGITLTYATYERLGKLEGAIATQAEAVLERCEPEDRRALASVLFSLVEMGTAEGTVERAIARRVPLATFLPGTPQRRLVEALLDPDARLLVSDTEKDASPSVRLAHEALISRWAQARDFVQSNAEALRIRHRIEERYALWRGLDKRRQVEGSAPIAAELSGWRARFGREQGLLTDIDLIDGRRLLNEHQMDTEPHLVAYIERSLADNKRLRARTVRVLATVATIVTILAIVASGSGWVASQRQHQAEYQATETLKAQARLLTEAAAQHLKDSDVSGAQGIILEVLTNPRFAQSRTPEAISTFQDVRSADSQLVIFSGHNGAVMCAASSPDDSQVLTASTDGTARLWDARSGALQAVLSGHTGAVGTAVHSPDGAHILTASKDKTARIWDARSGEQLRVLSGHAGTVRAAAYSPDGAYVVTASYDKTARIWDADKGSALLTLTGHTNWVMTAAYSPDGRRIVTASLDKTARIWDARTGAQLLVLSGHEGSVMAAAYSPDGERIVTASVDKTARIWDARTGSQLLVLLGHGADVESAVYSPDGRFILTGSDDKTARVWDARTGAQIKVLAGHGREVYRAAYSHDGRRIITASLDGTARSWDAIAAGQLATLSGHSGAVTFAAYSWDGARIVTASYDKTARVWDARSGAQLETLSGSANWLLSAAYSPDGLRIVTASLDKTARIWDANTGAQLALLSGHDGGVTAATFSPDGTRVVTSSTDKTARIWDARTGAQLFVLSGHGSPVDFAGYSPDGTRIVTASYDKTARIWDSRDGNQVAVLSGHDGALMDASYSPDGTRVVTASDDSTVRVWDAHTGAELAVLSGHRNQVNSAVYSPDGTRIVTASNDKSARIWDSHTGIQLAALLGGDRVTDAAYSPDGMHIVTASDDGNARIWDARVLANVDAQIAWQRSAEFDPLTAVERTQLGLPVDGNKRTWPVTASACDEAAAAFYDPERTARGISATDISSDVAAPACGSDAAKLNIPSRVVFQWGRALLAKGDLPGAKSQFELAISRGSRAARIDLANMLTNPIAGVTDTRQAILQYQQSWESGIPIAAYELGHLYENGMPSSTAGAPVTFAPNLATAWSWYQKGADVGEPTALARFAERDEKSAGMETDPSKRDALLLHAFAYYAAAAERAHDEDWPDDAWRNWRYRRATLARLLAHEGMMQQAADAYREVHERWSPHPLTVWQKIEAKLHH
jgi:WD40 repeat protein/TPR repeat protein